MQNNLPTYPHYKPSGVQWLGDIPEHWKVKPGFTIISERKEKNIGLKINTVLSLSYGNVIIKPEEKLTGLVPESFETYQIVYPNDIIIRPTDLQNDKTSLRTGLAKNHGIITSAYINILVKEGNNSSYLHYFFHCVDITKVIYGLGSGLRQNLDFRDFKRFSFLVPPLSEQTAIAQFLDRKTAQIDKAIDLKEKQIELLKERRQILIHQAVTRGLNPDVPMKDSGIEWIGEIPAHWEVTQIKKIAQTTSGGTPPSGNIKEYYNGHIPWVRTTDLNNDELYDVPEKITDKAIRDTACKVVPVNTVCVAMYGGPGSIGKHSILRFSATLNQALCGIISSEKLYCEFLYYYVKFCRPYWMINAKGTRVDPNISQDEVRKMSITFPPKSEQIAIAEHIKFLSKKIDTAIGLKEQEIEKLKEYKASLINSVVTGKVKVTENPEG